MRGSMPPGPWLLAGEVQHRLGLSYQQIRRLRKLGELTTFRVAGGRPHYLEADVERLGLEALTLRKRAETA